jgi:hypothetical protein
MPRLRRSLKVPASPLPLPPPPLRSCRLLRHDSHLHRCLLRHASPVPALDQSPNLLPRHGHLHAPPAPNPRFYLSCAASSLTSTAESETQLSGSPQRTKHPSALARFASTLRTSGGHLLPHPPALYCLSRFVSCYALSDLVGWRFPQGSGRSSGCSLGSVSNRWRD